MRSLFPKETLKGHSSYQGFQGKMLEGRFSLPSYQNTSLLLEGAGPGMRSLFQTKLFLEAN